MTKSKLFAVFIGLFFSIISSAYAGDASMMPPKALNNQVYNSMVGTWVGDSNMMGTPMRDTLKINWALNHQFITMDLKAKSITQPKQGYEGMGVFGVDTSGQAKTWWFDTWGASAAATGTGNFAGNTITLTDGNDMFNETRTFTINGNKMVMTAVGNMTINGKSTPFNQKVIYTKMSG